MVFACLILTGKMLSNFGPSQWQNCSGWSNVPEGLKCLILAGYFVEAPPLYFNFWIHYSVLIRATLCRGVARRGPGVPVTPLGRPSFDKTTYNIRVAKTPWQYLGRKSHCWKHHFFKICFFVKYFRQRLLSLANMGLHAAIIQSSPLIHEWEQRYKPYIVGDPRMVSLLWSPLWKILATHLLWMDHLHASCPKAWTPGPGCSKLN